METSLIQLDLGRNYLSGSLRLTPSKEQAFREVLITYCCHMNPVLTSLPLLIKIQVVPLSAKCKARILSFNRSLFHLVQCPISLAGLLHSAPKATWWLVVHAPEGGDLGRERGVMVGFIPPRRSTLFPSSFGVLQIFQVIPTLFGSCLSLYPAG